jgi:hypothetical protein
MQHPGDEFWNDWVVGGFNGESEFDRHLPFQPFKPDGFPYLTRSLNLESLEPPRYRTSHNQHSSTGSFWPLALGMLIGGMLAGEFGGPILAFVGAIAGLAVALRVTR